MTSSIADASIADATDAGLHAVGVGAERYPIAAYGARVAILGLGYVGLPTALAFAESGSTVIGLDISLARLDAIEMGDVDLLDPDHERLRRFRGTPRLHLTADAAAISRADTVVVCTPTPVDEHLVPDLRALSAACRTVVAHATAGQLILLTSTTYVGTTRDLVIVPLQKRGFRVGHDIFVAFAPERIDPGNTVFPQAGTPRVIGGATLGCTMRTAKALSRVALAIHEVASPEAAEMTKLLENTFRAVNIAMANEFADACRDLDIDVMEVISAAATKPYGFMPFYPGAGVGGHCIPCDPHYLLWQMRSKRRSAPLIEAAMTLIAGRPHRVIERSREVLAETGKAVRGARVLVEGLSYKPGVADIRESPALEIIAELIELGAEVSFHDDFVGEAVVAGATMRSTGRPQDIRWDLVIVHTLHPGTDLGWLDGQQAVLDTTYRLTALPARHTL